MASKKTIKKTKLIRLLKTFSPLEWKRFGRFVQSPYHNSNQTIIKFFTVLKKLFPFETEEGLEQESVFKKVFGKKEFKSSKFQNLCSDLYGLAEDFLIDVYLQKEKRQRKKVLVDALSERDYELFKGESQKLIQEIETQKWFLGSNDFLLLYKLNDQFHHHLETEKFTSNQIALERTWRYLTAFFENEMAQINAENATAKNFIIREKGTTTINQDKLKILFLEIAKLHEVKQTELYFTIKENILHNWDFINKKNKTDLLVHLINFSITNEVLQKNFGYTETFQLYKIGVEEKLFIINGNMRDVEFINIGIVGFALKENNWTDQFIENNQNYLSHEVREFLIPLIYAYKANYNQDYALVIELLSTLNPINQLNYLHKIKSLLIRSYFEGILHGKEAYWNPLNHEMESLKKMMLRNNKLSPLKIKGNINFLKLTKKLVNLYWNKKVMFHQIHSFELLLENTKPLLLKDWLKKKFEEIKSVAS